MENGLTAIIVCGGQGSRLGPLGEVINKNLLPYNGAPMLLSVVGAVQRLGCTNCVFLTGHLSPQIEKIVQTYAKDLAVSFMPDTAVQGTACCVRNAALSLGLDDYIYAHGNIAIDEKPLENLIEAIALSPKDHSVLAVSDIAIAPTHTKVTVRNGIVTGSSSAESPSMYSVGFGLFRGMLGFMKSHNAKPGQKLEDWLLQDPADHDTIKAVNIDDGWHHLESLDFYKS